MNGRENQVSYCTFVAHRMANTCFTLLWDTRSDCNFQGFRATVREWRRADESKQERERGGKRSRRSTRLSVVVCCIAALTPGHNNLGNVIYSYQNPCNIVFDHRNINSQLHARASALSYFQRSLLSLMCIFLSRAIRSSLSNAAFWYKHHIYNSIVLLHISNFNLESYAVILPYLKSCHHMLYLIQCVCVWQFRFGNVVEAFFVLMANKACERNRYLR